MTVYYDPAFLNKLKKVDVRIRKNVKEKILLFSKNSKNPLLNNHPLREKYQGYRSISITSNWRAIYIEKHEGSEIVAYFVLLGTHKDLYRP